MKLVSISRNAIPPKTDRGGDMRVLLSPRTVETKTAFMGTLTLAPGELFGKHYHPYSDEYIYIVEGNVTITGEENSITAEAGAAVFIPQHAPHRLENTGSQDTTIVFFSTPLAPRPDLGHVILEDGVNE